MLEPLWPEPSADVGRCERQLDYVDEEFLLRQERSTTKVHSRIYEAAYLGMHMPYVPSCA